MEEMEISLESVGTEGLENAKYIVVGRIIADKILNRRGVLSILKGLWLEEMVFSIREMGLNRYSIAFRLEVLIQRVMEEGPWSVMGYTLILERWSEGMSIEEGKNGHTDRSGGSNDNCWMGRGFLRFRVGLTSNSPLLEGFWVPRRERNKVWASIKYEKLSDFCFACGKLWHFWKNCDKKGEMSSVVPHRQRFGAHLRVGPIRKETGEVREEGGARGYQRNKEIKKGILGDARGIDEREEVTCGEKMYQEGKEPRGKEVVREVEMWRC
ncbi:hypothetical protein CRYUN_Cryun27aG0016800 [Craigia yunnanensis]